MGMMMKTLLIFTLLILSWFSYEVEAAVKCDKGELQDNKMKKRCKNKSNCVWSKKKIGGYHCVYTDSNEDNSCTKLSKNKRYANVKANLCLLCAGTIDNCKKCKVVDVGFAQVQCTECKTGYTKSEDNLRCDDD